jgi:chromosomal replication initiation ATPase DnaA
MKDNLEAKFYNQVFESAQAENPNIKTIEFQVDYDIDNPSNANVIDCGNYFKESSKTKSKKTKEASSESKITTQKSVNDRYTLKNFIVGSDSQLAYSACDAVCRNPGKSYNPLYIYGDV